MPLTIEELTKNKPDFVLEFHLKDKSNHEYLTDQDKKHIRIMAILRLTRDKQLEYIFTHEFTESFKFDKEKGVAYYLIKIIKRKKGKTIYADC